MSDINLAYVGTVVPDSPDYAGPAFSRAGNMAQLNLLRGMVRAETVPSLILSQQPMPSFPRGRILYSKLDQVKLSPRLIARLIPFINAPVLRPISVGINIAMALLRWAYGKRTVSKRVVITFNLTEPSGIFTLLAARLARAQAVAWINDINIPGETVPNNWMRRLDFWLQRRILPRFDALVVVSERIIKDFAPGKNHICMDGGIASEILLNQSSPADRNKEKTFFTIVSAGSLDDQNGVSEILEAFSYLEGPRYRLRIAGAGPLEGKVRNEALHDSRIVYCGYLSYQQVLALYRDADVLINMRITNRIKTPYFFPSKLLEYMASGVPVITTRTGHVEKEYGEYVFLLESETSLALAKMIRDVATLSSESRNVKGEAARKYMSEYGTWDSRAIKLAGFLRQLTGGRA